MTAQKTELTLEQRREEFLKELTDLTYKYGLEISGCGCCDSPVVRNLSHPTETERRYSVYSRGGDLRLRKPEEIEEQEWWLKDD